MYVCMSMCATVCSTYSHVLVLVLGSGEHIYLSSFSCLLFLFCCVVFLIFAVIVFLDLLPICL